MKRVKGEGEGLSYLSSHININSSCIFIFLEQEYRNPAFTFTLHTPPGSQVRQLPKILPAFFASKINLPAGGSQIGRWGRVFSAPAAGAQGIPERPSGGTSGLALSIADRLPYEPLGRF